LCKGEFEVAEIEVNLSESEQKALREISLRTGKSESELIRDAVDNLIKRDRSPRNAAMSQARGIWRDRNDLPDFGRIRREWDRL
jgi:hypothetical protein